MKVVASLDYQLFVTNASQWAREAQLDQSGDYVCYGAQSLMPHAYMGRVESNCLRYRYLAWCQWGDGPSIGFVLHYPGNLTAELEQCARYASAHGFGAVAITYLLCAQGMSALGMMTMQHPAAPARAPDHRYQAWSVLFGGGGFPQLFPVVAAWNAEDGDRDRLYSEAASEFVAWTKSNRRELHHIGLTKHGIPKHPRSFDRHVPLMLWEAAA